MNQPSSGRWADLAPRVGSGVVMAAIGLAALWAGGGWLAALVVLCSGLMIWELARMTEPQGTPAAMVPVSVLLGLLAGCSMALMLQIESGLGLLLLLVPAVVGLFMPRRDPWIFAAYALVIMLTGLSLLLLRQHHGAVVLLWLVLVVAGSDIAGYFAGRILGGPKFWPAISPKKTWSGTVAGWIAAAFVSLLFLWAGHGSRAMVFMAPVIAFAGQMGDIAESAIKRRAGVKDSSNLIPGHGGVLDRFDALAFAAIATLVLEGLIGFLPVQG